MNCVFGILSKKSLLNPRSQVLLPMFSSKRFLGFIFRSVLHFELIHMACIEILKSFFSVYGYPSIIPCIENYDLFSIELPLNLCKKLAAHICMGLVPDSAFASTGPYASAHSLDGSLSPRRRFFLQPPEVSSHVRTHQYSAENLRGTPGVSEALSV